MTERERLIGLLDIIIQPGQKTLGDIADYLLENGVIVPPCKVGDTVYIIDGGQICEGVVIKIFGELDNETVYTMEYTDCCDDIVESDFIESDYGITVFLTKEEAQKELLCRIARG